MVYVVAAAAAVCVLVLLLSHLRIKRAFDQIDGVLEDMINKKPPQSQDSLKDDRISKLYHKASRIMGMYVSDADTALREKEAIQGFISDMSHQMKTPLAGISMYSQLLLDGRLKTEEKTEFLGRIQNLSQKLTWMMDCLIKMSRLEIGAIELSPQNAPVNETIGAAVETVISAAAKKNIEISVFKTEGLCLYHDKKWTAEAVSNVLENAVKYSPMGSRIELEAEPLALYTKITVRDQGMGVARADYNEIFKRFYRGKNAKEQAGAGLGLYLVRLIMEKQGGYIMVESGGQGAEFSLFLQNCKK